MDIGGVSSTYAGIVQAQTDNQELEKLKADWSTANEGTDDEQLMDVCKQFEAYFIEQVMKEAEKTIPETEYSLQSTGTMVDYFKDSMIQELASRVTDAGGVGLAQMLYDQMKVTTVDPSTVLNADTTTE